MKKLICALLTLVLAIGLFAGCDLLESDPKTFTAGDLTITLNEDFKESTEDNGYDATFESRTAIVFVLEDGFESVEEGTTLEEYVELSLDANNREDLEVKESGDFLYVEYVDDVEGEDYYYKVAYYMGSEAFWVVNFTTPNTNVSKLGSKIDQWAASVVVE